MMELTQSEDKTFRLLSLIHRSDFSYTSLAMDLMRLDHSKQVSLAKCSIANKDSTEVENFPPLKNAGRRDSALNQWKSN